jgi:UDP-glucose:(heptosyl)LPS alpha-1,3-glucosyltransferase
MQVGLVIEEFDPHRGGAEQWTFNHAGQLLALGHAVHVITGRVGEAARESGCEFHLFEPGPSRAARAEAAEKILRTLSLEVVHDIGLGWFCDILQSEDGSRLAQWDKMLQTLPALCRPVKQALIRTLPRYREFRRQLARQYGDPQRIFIAVSQMCARDFQAYHGVAPTQIRLVYHGIDTARFAPHQRLWHRRATRQQLGVRDDEVAFLFVGHDARRKGLSTAVRAVRRLAVRGLPVRLLVVGGRRRAAPHHSARPTRETIVWAGRVTDPVPWYAAADAFVLPTFYDPCSLSVGEAAASGLPVVTTRCNGASELLTPGHNGYILEDPADDRTLAGHLEQLLDTRVRQRMGAEARRMALRYPLDRNCAELLAIYQEVAQRKNPAGRRSRISLRTANPAAGFFVAGQRRAA